MNEKIPVFVFWGPTAAGKTAFLFDLFVGGDVAVPAEVVSADSMQVYRGMDIGTAKPDCAARTALPHHLIDLRDPGEQFNAGEFVRLADECCADIYARGKLPVVAGGSGFYLKNFIQGLPDSPPGSEAIRLQLKREFEADGMDVDALYAELQKGDPAAASRIHRNDSYRVIRALEVMRLTGKPLSAFEAANRKKKEARSRRYDFLAAGLTRNREELYTRINARVDRMFEEGLPDEVRVLFAKGWTPGDPGMRAIGYREFFVAGDESGRGEGKPFPGEFRENSDPRWMFTSDIEGAREMIKQSSRHYAKRQETFFRGMDIESARRFVVGAGANGADSEDRVKASVRALVQDFWGKHYA